MLENINIGSKIYIGFGAVLLVLAVLAGEEVYSNINNKAMLGDYRSSAKQTNEAGRIQANMLEARLAFRKFLSTPSDNFRLEVLERLKTANSSVESLMALATTDVVKSAISGFDEQINDYGVGFQKVAELQIQRNEIVSTTLDKIGPKMSEDIVGLRETLETAGATQASMTTGKLQYAVVNMRLGANKFLLNNNEASATQAIESAGLAGQQLAEVDKEVNDQAARAVLETVRADLAAYESAFRNVHELVDEQNIIISETLDKIGPSLSGSIEQLKLNLKKDQDTLGPQIQSTMESGIVTAELLAVFGLVLASVIAIVIARSITRPVGAITSAMAALADNKLDTEIPGLAHRSEIGLMAKAVDVFKQNAIRIRQLAAQEAALQAKSADLQTSIGEVVSAAVAGDFTQRINKDYDNADLNRFVAQVNELVTSVDGGIEETRRVVSALAEGDLTETMRGEFQGAFGELQQNVNSTMANLRSVLGEVRSAIDTINSGAGEMRNASIDLSKRTEQQAASLEETSSALEEITVAVRSSTERSTEASHMVDEAGRSTEQSSLVVQQAVSAMGRIDQASGEIGQIINVIDEIAFQTNLLALNAGVEAARAGDAGKGFAVVAQEVRELAQRSANAAKDIKGLISRSSGEVKSGVKLVTATGEALDQIQGHVLKINEHVHSIATAAREQSTGLSEVSTAVNHMDQVTQQNAAMVEESTASTNHLADEASNLARLIARFRLGDGRGAAPQTANADMRPVSSPARVLTRKIAGVFGAAGSAAVSSEWEEF